jgi:hypothetical protein
MEPYDQIPDEQIRARAHDIWDRHHQPVGYDLQFWFMAERELRAERRAKAEPGVATEEDAAAYEALTT